MFNNSFQQHLKKCQSCNDSFSPLQPAHYSLRIIEEIQFYYTPLIVILGICGNVTSALVLGTTKLRLLSSSYYLVALVIADSGFLISLFVVWLELALDDVAIYNRNGVCQIVTYVTYVCSFLSIWYVVAFTVERFIAVEYPLRRPIVCTVSRAKFVLFLLTISALLGYLCVFYIASVEEINDRLSVCTSKEENLALVYVFNLLDTLFTLLLPIFLIVGLNVKIVRRVWKFSRFIGATDGSRAEASVLRVNSTQIKITKMLLLVSSVVLCFNFPSYSVRFLVLLQSMLNIPKNEDDNDLYYSVQQVSQLLFHTNFAINFILYCTTGANFRLALYQYCRCNSQPQNTFRRNKLKTGSFLETTFTSVKSENNSRQNSTDLENV